MRRMISHSLGIALLCGASAAVAQAPKTGPAGVVHACSLFTDADIARITGRREPIKMPADSSTLSGGRTECSWANLGAALTPRLTLQFFEQTRKAQENAKGVKVEPAPGVGDAAFFWERSAGPDRYVGLFFQVGQYQVGLTDMVPPDSVAWLKPKLVELAKFAIPKLR